MNHKIEIMHFNLVYELVDLLECVASLGCKWIFKIKRDADEKIKTFKARLSKRNISIMRKPSMSVAMVKSIRIFLSIVSHYDYEILQMDVKTTFLNGYLKETICMSQLEKFIEKSGAKCLQA